MKVLYMSTYSNMSGANRSMLGIIDYVKEWGVEPFVIIPKHGPIEDELREKGIPYKLIPSAIWVNPGDSEIKSHMKWILKKAINYLAEIKIGQYIRDNEINLVHINTVSNPAGAKYAIKCGIPLVWHIREMVEDDHNWKFYNENATYELLNKASKVVAISNSVRNRFAPFLKENLITVYNGIKINDSLMKRRNILETPDIQIVCAGRVLPEKGQLEAVKAVALLVKKGFDNLVLNIYGTVGDKRYHDSIVEYVKDHGLEKNVILHGYTSNMNQIWSETDIALVCSVAEAFGRVTVEAMMYGALVIGSDSAGTVELMNDMDTGLLYKQGDFEDLSAKLLFVIENKEKSRTMAKNGQAYMQTNMTAEKNAEKIFEIYQELVRSEGQT